MTLTQDRHSQNCRNDVSLGHLGNGIRHSRKRGRRHPEFNILSRVSNSHVSNNKDWFELSVEVPGIKSKNLTLTVDKGLLRLSGTRKIVSANGRVRRNFKFIKSFSLDDNVDIENLAVRRSRGLLIVSGPKRTKTVQSHSTTVDETTEASTDHDMDDEDNFSHQEESQLRREYQ